VRTSDLAAGRAAGIMIETDANRAAVTALFNQFLQALNQHDPDGCESLLAQLQGLVAPAALADIASRLTEFDFRGADVLTRALLHDLNIST
jgi:hypothetical protein